MSLWLIWMFHLRINKSNTEWGPFFSLNICSFKALHSCCFTQSQPAGIGGMILWRFVASGKWERETNRSNHREVNGDAVRQSSPSDFHLAYISGISRACSDNSLPAFPCRSSSLHAELTALKGLNISSHFLSGHRTLGDNGGGGEERFRSLWPWRLKRGRLDWATSSTLVCIINLSGGWLPLEP